MSSHKWITYLLKEEDKNYKEMDIFLIFFEPQSLSRVNSIFYSSFKTLASFVLHAEGCRENLF